MILLLYIANHEIKYQSALINVNEHSHYVDIAKKDRLIFSIIFLEDDYYTVKTIYK